jgi:hypothetical protein
MDLLRNSHRFVWRLIGLSTTLLVEPKAVYPWMKASQKTTFDLTRLIDSQVLPNFPPRSQNDASKECTSRSQLWGVAR